MSKQGQHKNDVNDQRKSKGVNRPGQSQPMTSGSYKKPETYSAQAREGKDVNRPGQITQHEWREDTRDPKKQGQRTRAQHPTSGRSGSQSNAK